MDEILKGAKIQKAALDEQELALINGQTLRPMTMDEVYAFRLAACNDQIDRDNECFTLETLEQLAVLYPGRPVLRDHRWSVDTQTARVYAAGVEPMVGGGKQLVLRCYMPRLQSNEDTIAAIESGLLRECSVGVMVERVLCSICGADQRKTYCEHRGGHEYDGQLCHFALDGAYDALEVSLVAVPAQPQAGIIKSKRYGGPEGLPPAPCDTPSWQDKARLEVENYRF